MEAARLRAVDSPRRRAILRLVWRRELAAGEIHRALGDVTFGAVSQHLRKLEAAGLARCRRDGRRRLYSADHEALGSLGPYLEAMWTDGLERLRDAAERREARGPSDRDSKEQR